MRQRMVGLGDADLRVRPPAVLAAQHEGHDPRQVALVGQHLQVAHQRAVLLVVCRNPAGLLHQRQIHRALRLGVLDAPLHVAHGGQVLVEPGAVAEAQLLLQVREGVEQRVEDAAAPPQAQLALSRVRRPAVAEQPLEHHAGVVLGRRLRRRAGPRERVDEGARGVVARADEVEAIERELERGQLRVLPELPRRDLIDRRARLDPLGGPPSDHAGQKPGRRRRMRAAAVLHAVQSREHEHAIPEGRQRLEYRRQIERALAGRCPVGHDHPVGHVDHAEAPDRRRRRLRERGERRRHRIQQRQRHRGTGYPRRNVRRGNAVFVIIMVGLSASVQPLSAWVRQGSAWRPAFPSRVGRSRRPRR